MRLETTAGHMHSALRVLNKVVEKRNTIPILGMVKFENGTITGTNLDMEVDVKLPLIGEQTGSATIDFAVLSRLMALTPAGDEVVLSEDENERVATAKFNGAEYRMASLPTTDFPEILTNWRPKKKDYVALGNAGHREQAEVVEQGDEILAVQ